MKISILFFLLLSGILHSARAQVRVIERPVVGNPNTETVDICRIELSPESTVLWIDLYNCSGNWVNILSKTVLRSADGNRTYRLLACEGMEMDRNTVIPEQGYLSCKLIFEPLSPEEKTIDYIEGPGTETWNLKDIHLYPEEKRKPGAIQCRIRGEVIGRPYSPRLILIKAGEDVRTVGTYIPVRDGKFEYQLDCEVCEAYELVFEEELCQGGYRAIDFFAENGEVSMVLYPREEGDKNRVNGGKEDQTYRKFLEAERQAVPFDELNTQREQLMKSGKYYSPESEELMKRASEAENRQVTDSLWAVYHRWQKVDSIYTPEGVAMEERYLAQTRKSKKWMMEYVREYPSLACYYVLLRAYRNHLQVKRYEDIPRFLAYQEMDEAEVEKLLETVYRPLYPDHPYTREFDDYRRTQTDIRVGGRFIDFTAPDLETGKPVTLSDRIQGKIALIDLWASWCGPCRRNAKEMIPVYEKYEDRGFTVVGVAREKNRSSGLEAARKDRHPWTDLLELNDRGKIWKNYGIENAGGSTFLVDRDGKILAINPTVEEVLEILETQL